MKTPAIGISIILCLLLSACSAGKAAVGKGLPRPKKGGEAFRIQADAANVPERDSMAVRWYSDGNFPEFMRRFARVDVEFATSDGRNVKAHYYVAPDYLCVGTDSDFLRLPVTPHAGQRIADMLGCFLSTPKICDDVYRAADVKLEPMPMMYEREALQTFVVHNYIIEGQRKGRKGLVAGHKKDVVITQVLSGKPGRIALYGWHKPDGKPIQPVYTGHIMRYVDYSHGFRLVKREIWVDGREMDYTEVLAHPEYWRALSYDPGQTFTAYPTR